MKKAKDDMRPQYKRSDFAKLERGKFHAQGTMTTVTVSSRFQVVIPKEIREHLRLKPGQKLQVMAYEGRIELIPVRSARDLRGAFRDLNPAFEREADRLL